MRQKNRRRSLLTLYHHHGNDKRISGENHNHHDNHLLHSDKSTYTALRFGPLSGRKLSNLQRPVLFSPEKRGFLEKMMSYAHLSKANNTYFYRLKRLVNKLRLGPQNSAHTSIPLLVSGFGLLMLLGVMISPNATESASAEAWSSGGGMSVKLELKDPEVNTLTTQAETGKVNYISKGFTVTTANVDGYNVYVQTAPGASNKLQNGSITIDFVKTEDTAPANFADNSWGYKVDATGTVPENLTYSPVPEATATNLNPAYSSNSTGETRDFTLNFAAKFASSATPGHYGTDVILSVAAGAEQIANLYSITYNANGNTGGVTPVTQVAESGNATYTFATPAVDQYGLTKTGYTLAGWSEDPDTNLPEYLPGETVTLTLASPNKTLYAVWANWSNLMIMQSMTPEICASTNIGDSKTLIDARDDTPYVIKKLNDGKCWMDQNLHIINKTLTSADSDVIYDYVIPSSSLWSGTDFNINKAYYANDVIYGAYYTYYSATAGANPASGDANSSICPKGWKLPTIGEFQALVDKGKSSWVTNNGKSGFWFGGNVNTSGATFFPASGAVTNGNLVNAGSNTDYWSSTAISGSSYDVAQVKVLFFSQSNDGRFNYSYRYNGNPVRCVAR